MHHPAPATQHTTSSLRSRRTPRSHRDRSRPRTASPARTSAQPDRDRRRNLRPPQALRRRRATSDSPEEQAARLRRGHSASNRPRPPSAVPIRRGARSPRASRRSVSPGSSSACLPGVLGSAASIAPERERSVTVRRSDGRSSSTGRHRRERRASDPPRAAGAGPDLAAPSKKLSATPPRARSAAGGPDGDQHVESLSVVEPTEPAVRRLAPHCSRSGSFGLRVSPAHPAGTLRADRPAPRRCPATRGHDAGREAFHGRLIARRLRLVYRGSTRSRRSPPRRVSSSTACSASAASCCAALPTSSRTRRGRVRSRRGPTFRHDPAPSTRPRAQGPAGTTSPRSSRRSARVRWSGLLRLRAAGYEADEAALHRQAETKDVETTVVTVISTIYSELRPAFDDHPLSIRGRE